MSSTAILTGIMTFGLLHGVNPSHGWPMAILYSMKSKNPMLSGIVSSSVIAGAHFVSSIAVVIAYILLTSIIEIPQFYMRYGAAIALGILAYVFWKEKGEDFAYTQHEHLHDDVMIVKEGTTAGRHEHDHWHHDLGNHSHIHVHQRRDLPSLKKIVSFAFILGFAHEEEFVILAIAATQTIDPIILMIAYASSVAGALIGITVILVKLYQRYFQYKMIYYSKYLPKIAGIFLAVMAVGFAIGLF